MKQTETNNKVVMFHGIKAYNGRSEYRLKKRITNIFNQLV